jgi:hypothetical protein
LRTSDLAGRWRPLLAATFATLALSLAGACSTTAPPAAEPLPASPTAGTPAASAPPPPPSADPQAPNTVPTAAKPPRQPPPSVAGTCGTVTAASGLTLQLLGGEGGGVDCATGRRIVEEFHQKLAGRQPADSNEPISDSVEGWQCTSGPPTAQGGTSCGKEDKSIFAGVVPSE